MEKSMGLSLEPDSLFGDLLRGVDVVRAQRASGQEDSDLLVIAKFKSAEVAGKFMKHIEEQAASPDESETSAASQSSDSAAGAASASSPTPAPPTPTPKSLQRQEIAGTSVLVVPGDGLWVCTKGDTLIAASSAGMMTKALGPKSAGDFMQRPAVREGLEALGNPSKAQVFFFADQSGSPSSLLGALPVGELQGENGQFKVVGVVTAAADHIDLKFHVPPCKADAQALQEAAKFPPSAMQIRKTVPESAMLSVAFNALDGAAIYDKALAGANATQQPDPSQGMLATILKPQLTQLVSLEPKLGFKIKDDLLASIGPEVLLTIDTLQFNIMNSNSPLTVDATLGLQVRDQAKVSTCLDKLEKYLLEQAKTMTPTAAPGQSAPPAAPTAMNAIAVGNTKGKFLALVPQSEQGIGWVNLDGMLVIGTTERALQRAAKAASGAEPSLPSSAKYQSAQAYFPAKSNIEAMVSVRPITDLATTISMMAFGGRMQGEEAMMMQAGLDILRSFDKLMLSVSVSPKGDAVGAVALTF